MNSNASTRPWKGRRGLVQRPAPSAPRAQLGRLPFVDAVVIFRGKRLDREIAALRPDLYCKAGDYTLAKLDRAERAALEAAGSRRFKFMPFLRWPQHDPKIAELKSAGRL